LIENCDFIKKLKFTIAAYHIDAMEKSHKLKPTIPYFGNDGVSIKDEIEPEMILS